MEQKMLLIFVPLVYIYWPKLHKCGYSDLNYVRLKKPQYPSGLD